jgi:hypothetical protein
MSLFIASTYSMSSFSGFVSSHAQNAFPAKILRHSEVDKEALAWPMWSHPLGSGGKRVCTSLKRPVRRSSVTASRMKI